VVPNQPASEEPALLTSRSTGRDVSVSRAAAVSMPSVVLRSARTTPTTTPCLARSSSATWSSRSCVRATMTRSYPSAASWRANDKPIPEVAPVTRARRDMAQACQSAHQSVALGPAGGCCGTMTSVTTTIAVANQKGGVARTTTVASLGAALVELGQRVLLVDADPQASLTFAFGLDPAELDVTIGEVLLGTAKAAEAI